MQTKTVLVFVPHPDDAEFYAGGTICAMADQGCQIVLVIATNGDKASFHTASSELRLQRSEEAKRGSTALGVSKLIMLGYPDFELDKLPYGILREQFFRLVRQYRPDVVFAEDAIFVNEVHPDHRAVAMAASDAVSFSHLPLIYPEQLVEELSPHYVIEKYFFSDNLTAANKVVDISATFERKIAALGEHRSQVEFLVEEIFMQAKLAGIDVVPLLGEAASDPLATIRWALQAQAMEIGKPAGFQYAEAFRYTRFHPYIEGILEAQSGVKGEGDR